MSIARAQRVLNSWETVRYELLNTRICDMELGLEATPIERRIERLYRELSAKGLKFRPEIYITDRLGLPG